jgi:hypothetical protein
MLPRKSTPLALAAALALSAVPARAQYLPSSPLALADGRIVIGGDVATTISERDEVGWFNYTDYEHDALRLFRIGVSGQWRIASRLEVLGEVRSENGARPEAYAAYVRVRPFPTVPLDVQAGKIPPTFGAFGRRLYSDDNPLIGYPLAYQYLLSIRPDAIPASNDDLLRMRARGWQSSFPVGSAEARPGVSVVSGFDWDAGVQVRGGIDRVEGAIAITNGSLSAPRFGDDNGGKQVSGRVQIQPAFGLFLGVSAARGAWLSRDVERLVAAGQDASMQRAIGLDAEYSRGHWIVRGEAIHSAWEIPGVFSPTARLDIRATTGWVESSYRLTPRLFIAARADALTFSRIRGTLFDGQSTEWDAPITRAEVGGGWYLQRNFIAKAAVQSNWRDGGRQTRRTFVSAQLLFWF